MLKPESKQEWPGYYGTFRNHSPEIFRNEPFDEKVDCWAAGLIYYSLLFGSHPFMKRIDADSATIEDHHIRQSVLEDTPDLNADLNLSQLGKFLV